MKKHLFIINPTAGKTDPAPRIIPQIKALRDRGEDVSYEITHAPGNAGELVKKYLAEGPEELVCYACGGDGTLFEVVNGGVGHPAFRVSVVPTGSGNDFIKSFPEYSKEDFLNLDRLVHGTTRTIDSLKVGKYTSVNIISAGFDAEVCRYMSTKYKNLPLISGKNAYKLALVDAVIKDRRNFFTLSQDGKQFEDGTHPHLFAIAANGCWYGGGFKASPESVLDDGLMNIITIPTVSILKFAELVGLYRRGEHIHSPKMPFVRHSLGHELAMERDADITLNIDGEMISMKNPVVRIMPASVKVVLPK